MLQSNVQLEKYLNLWDLVAISSPLITATSQLQKVQDSAGQLRMLKITEDLDEIRGITQLKVWSRDNNSACVDVIAAMNHAILLDYAPESLSLLPEALVQITHLSATIKLANNVFQLHQTALSQFEDLRPLRDVFESLWRLGNEGFLLQKAQKIAEELLKTTTSDVPLHGDAHHGNILYFAGNQLRAIDPKGFHGEHYFDYLPIFINPDLGEMRMNRGLFEEKLIGLCDPNNSYLLERSRLIRWIFVGTALSAAWFLEDEMRSEADQQLILLQWIVDEDLL